LGQAAWPTAAELTALFTGLGLAVPDGVDLEIHANAAVAEWDRRTGYQPFLSGASATRRFDPPNSGRVPGFWTYRGGRKILDLRAGVTAVTQVSAYVSADDSGTELTVDEDYWLLPLNAAERSSPYTQIEFRSPKFGQAASIEVTGTWGFADTVPDDAYLAVLNYAAANVLSVIREALMAGVVEWKEGDISERSSIENIAKLGEGWRAEFDKAVRRYRRVVL
jgi:hypothetical protein